MRRSTEKAARNGALEEAARVLDEEIAGARGILAWLPERCVHTRDHLDRLAGELRDMASRIRRLKT